MPRGSSYRTNPANASSAIFASGDESIGSFARSGTTVTVSTGRPHGVIGGDRSFVTGTGTMDGNAFSCVRGPPLIPSRIPGQRHGPDDGSYRKHSAATFAQAGILSR